MATKIAINGFGRIGRLILRKAVKENKLVRFDWIENAEAEESNYFEFKIIIHDSSNLLK